VGALLIEHWIGGLPAIDVRDAASVALVREEVRRVAARQGLDTRAAESLAAAASELGHNQLVHAHDGEIAVVPIERDGVPGVEVVAADRGPGIAEPADALLGRVVGKGLGVGLSAAYRQVDELDVDVRHGEGTCLRARRFARPVRRSEVAVLGIPFPDEPESGDHGVVCRDGRSLFLGVADGLGHGRPARAAADAAVGTLLGGADRPLDELVAACDRALVHTRGAVLALCRMTLADRVLAHAGAGNITSRLLLRDGTLRTLASSARVVGGGLRPGSLATETHTLHPDDTLILHSDGLRSRIELPDLRLLVRRPVLVVADALFKALYRGTDDALIIVAR
jgi:anti-sigma regulatory factor (Ser/Thr protein kinase)